MTESSKSTRIPELAAIELTSTTALKRFTEEARRLSRDFGRELETGAMEIEAILSATGQGNIVLMGQDVKWRARNIAKRAYRASDLQQGVSVEMTRLWHDFQIQFAPLLQNHRTPGKTFDFDN